MADSPSASVRFARLESRSLLLGLTLAQLCAVGVAFVVAGTGQYVAGTVGLAVTSLLWSPLLAGALTPVGGRPAMTWLPVLGSWQWRNVTGGTRHLTDLRADPTQLAIPGVRGLRLTATGSGTALVHDRRAGTVTAVLAVTGRGFALADDALQERRLDGWARVLGGLCQGPDIARVQVLARTRPGGTRSLASWWAGRANSGASWAADVVADVIADAARESHRNETLLAVALRNPRGRRPLSGIGLAQIEQQLTALADAVRAADLDVTGWLDLAGLGSALRGSYDPGSPGGRDDLAAGPLLPAMAVGEEWGRLRTDSGHHVVYWVREWPRSEVHAGFLAPLLTGGAHRTLSLTCEPLTAGKALRDIRRAKVEQAADAAQRARIGQIEDAAHRAEADDVARREADLVAGHGDLRFTGLLTVSASTREDLEAGCTATEAAAAQAMCELRRLAGQQATAFIVGALPLARRTS